MSNRWPRFELCRWLIRPVSDQLDILYLVLSLSHCRSCATHGPATWCFSSRSPARLCRLGVAPISRVTASTLLDPVGGSIEVGSVDVAAASTTGTTHQCEPPTCFLTTKAPDFQPGAADPLSCLWGFGDSDPSCISAGYSISLPSSLGTGTPMRAPPTTRLRVNVTSTCS